MHQHSNESLQQDLDSVEATSRKRQSLERNRLAAYRCRKRKKTEQEQMVQQADVLEVQNKSLQMMVHSLRNEVITLRELMLAHDVCNCEGVHTFIQRTSSSSF